MSEDNVNLFIYGSLRAPDIFESVSGLSITINPKKINAYTRFAEPAFLAGHKKLSPDGVYYYAVKSKNSKIEGFIAYDLPYSALSEIDKYEGKRYTRQTVKVHTANGTVNAYAYLVSKESMQKHFGDRFHVNLIHELWLRKRIQQFFEKHTRPGEHSTDAEVERRARRELLATTERDLVISHFKTEPISDYYIEHELNRPSPSIEHLYNDEKATPYLENYLALVIKQVILNQLDAKMQTRYRYKIEHMVTSERYFKRSVSILAALKILNQNIFSLNLIVKKGLQTIPRKSSDLIDYVKYAVKAADNFFDPRIAWSYLEQIHANLQPGLIPLGAEIELSNLGRAAVIQKKDDSKTPDSTYDDFRYFKDFNLDTLTWKLGGLIDDHTGETDLTRRLGFFELAPGRLNIAAEISRPATNDPWLLNQLIREIVTFYDVKPHSLHLSFQLTKNQIGKQKILPISFVKCLLALGGGLQQKQNGKLWVSRIQQHEIIQYHIGEELGFAKTSKKRWYLGDSQFADRAPKHAVNHIQQYKFIRLDERASYEPLILCLKGLQTAYNPADYLTIDQLNKHKPLRDDLKELKDWAANPQQLRQQTIGRFLNTVRTGLLNEVLRSPAHKPHYIDWALSTLDVQLRMFNKKIAKPFSP